MTMLVLAEHTHQSLCPSTLHAIGAALKLGLPVTVLVTGFHAQEAAREAAAVQGVGEVLLADNIAYAHFLAENVAALIADLAPSYTHVFAPATSFGKNILPRAAGLSGTALVSDIIGIRGPDTFIRAVYSGNAVATVQSKDKIKFVTVRSTAFDAAAKGGNAGIRTIDFAFDSGLSQFIDAKANRSGRPELSAAQVVVACGRGIESVEKFQSVIEPLADKLGAAIGATRAAVDAGVISNECQIGQTGKVVAPNLYIAIGLSGAVQHVAGICFRVCRNWRR
jgi:electron transfer flavoprotein alpha subunit